MIPPIVESSIFLRFVHITLWLLWKNSAKPAFYADFYRPRVAEPRKIEVFWRQRFQTAHLGYSPIAVNVGLKVRVRFLQGKAAQHSLS
jgi:hypothetical protein